MKRTFLLSLIFAFMVLNSSVLFSQDYGSSIGLRLGSPIAASYKKFLSYSGAFEAFLGVRSRYYWSSTDLGLAYLHHMPLNINNISSLKWYVGGGGLVSLWSYNRRYIYTGPDDRGVSFGVSGYIGIEYTFEGIPFNISLDWVPTIPIRGHDYYNGFVSGYGGLAFRYVIN